MSIAQFAEKYSYTPTLPIDRIVERWVVRKKVDDFLGTPIASGVVIADILLGDGLADLVSLDVYAGFNQLMNEKADSIFEIRNLFMEKAALSPDSVTGLINKIQGQIGENLFVKEVGMAARLASSGSQELWDVAIDRNGITQHVQVKVYADVGDALEEIREANEKILTASIFDGEMIVKKIDFAVNAEIYDEVREKVAELGLPSEVLNIGSTREKIRHLLENEASRSSEGVFDDLFDELLGGVLTAGGIHAAANAFLVWKGSKELSTAAEDTAYSTAISAGGMAVAYTLDALLFCELRVALGILGGPVVGTLAVGATLSTRALLRRFADRRFLVRQLRQDSENLQIRIEMMIQRTPKVVVR